MWKGRGRSRRARERNWIGNLKTRVLLNREEILKWMLLGALIFLAWQLDLFG